MNINRSVGSKIISQNRHDTEYINAIKSSGKQNKCIANIFIIIKGQSPEN